MILKTNPQTKFLRLNQVLGFLIALFLHVKIYLDIFYFSNEIQFFYKSIYSPIYLLTFNLVRFTRSDVAPH